MSQFTLIQRIGLLLSFIAGFCDTATFVAADNLFSAHVTGNFIVFAYEVIKGGASESIYKLLTFPVFIIGVMAATAIVGKIKDAKHAKTLLKVEAILLIIAGVTSYIANANLDIIQLYTVPVFIVLAMAVQNTFNRIYPKHTHGPTTVMTGNVTQLTIDIFNCILRNNEAKAKMLFSRSFIILCFLSGCIVGGKMADIFGLSVVAIVGVIAYVCSIFIKKVTV